MGATPAKTVLCFVLVVLAAATLYAVIRVPQCADDAFVTFRAAENLARGKGPYFNPGEAVQSSTTPLFLILLAAGRYYTGIETPDIAQAVEAPLAALLAVLLYLVARATPALRNFALLAPVLLFAQPFLLLRAKGMETYLFTALLLAAVWFESKRRRALVGCALGLLAATRTEGGLLGVAWFAYWLVGRRLYGNRVFSGPDLARVALFGLLAAAPFLGFVLTWYDSPIPSSVRAKMLQTGFPTCAGLLGKQLFGGPRTIDYARPYGAWQPWGAVLIAGLAAWAARRPCRAPDAADYRTLGFAASAGAFHAAPFLLLGAPAYPWYLIPLRVVLVLFETLALVVLWQVVAQDRVAPKEALPPVGTAAPTKARPGRGKRVAAVAALTILVLGIAWASAAAFRSILRDVRRGDTSFIFWQPRYRAVGEWLAAQAGSSGWTFAAYEIGLLGYYSDLPCLDLLGLASPATHPFATREPYARTVLRFAPELYVAASYAELTRGTPRYDAALADEFARRYRLVREFDAPACPIRVYCRRDLAWPPPESAKPNLTDRSYSASQNSLSIR